MVQEIELTLREPDLGEVKAMKAYCELSKEELAVELAEMRERYTAYKERGLKLNMARGKPAPEQLDLTLPMLNCITSENANEELCPGTADDLRNYGGLIGLPEMRELMGAVLGVPAANVMIGGNSSLNLMYNLVSLAMTKGVLGGTPWMLLEDKPRFLCPAPGYDRHFAICEFFGIEMIVVPIHETGPDMDVVEQYVNSDASVKGIWCVPRFSNPTGCVYSDETVRRMAALKPAAQDFRIYWDNAYAVHGFYDQGEEETTLLSLMDACEAASNSDLWYQFASTSKITFAGSGVAALASSEKNIKSISEALAIQTIGPDKINQKRHILFLPTLEAVQIHMAELASLIKPKFDTVLRVFEEGFAQTGIGEWTKPQGGYFISFDGPEHTARRTIALAAKAGVVLTPAGATYPYGKDPLDSNIRIAPTYPNLDELELAAEVFVVCVRIAALEKLEAQSEN